MSDHRAKLLGWGGLVLVFALQIATSAGWLSFLLAFPVLATLALLGAAWKWRISNAHQRVVLVILFSVSVLIALLPSLAAGLTLSFPLVRMSAVLTGWAIVLLLPLGSRQPLEELRSHDRIHWSIIALIVLAALGLGAWKHWAMVERYAVLQDEVLYWLQSRWMTRSGFGWQLEPELLPFFRPEYASYTNGRIVAQYPPGWPALLAIFAGAGLQWWSTPLLFAAAVLFTYLLGRDLHSPIVGVIAAALLTLQRWALESANGYMSHAASLAVVTAAAWLLVRGSRKPGAVPAAWVLSGFSLGLSLAIRPLSGLTIAATLTLWIALMDRFDSKQWGKLIVAMGAGGLLPFIGLLYYNFVTNGSPLIFGYTAVHGSLHDLGFGIRGFKYYAGQLSPVLEKAEYFGWTQALQNFARRSWEAADDALPLFLAIPLTWLASLYRVRTSWKIVLPFLLLPTAYFFYFFTNARFYTELAPFICLAAAFLVFRIASADRRTALQHVLPVLLLAGVISLATQERAEHSRGRSVLDAARTLEQTSARHGKILVFLHDPTWEAYLFRRLSFFNAEGLDSRILVARDLGPSRNQALIGRLPGHTPLSGSWDDAKGRLVLR